jgi:septal ring factor EnvC (AmiA/AmiB activator)
MFKTLKPVRWLLAALPSSAVRTAQRDLQQAHDDLRAAQAELARSAGRLKGLKAQPDANPQELGRMEGNVAAYTRRVVATRRWIAELEQQLDVLDPGHSPRRSQAPRVSP